MLWIDEINERTNKEYNTIQYNKILKFHSHHVDKIAAKNEKNQSATVIQKTSTMGNETDFFNFHLRMKSLMISEAPINDSAPPTLGRIAMDLAKGEYPLLIIPLLFSMVRQVILGGPVTKIEYFGTYLRYLPTNPTSHRCDNIPANPSWIPDIPLGFAPHHLQRN